MLADETRPYLQGARLTAWELWKDGIPVEVVTDSMAGYFMRRGEVKAVIVGADRIALTTDAMAAAGMPDGRYPLGPMTVDVEAGVARLAGTDGSTGAIAGGTARLIDVVRRAVVHAGVPLPDAVTAATATPARLLGLESEVGDVVPGRRADLLITDHDLLPRAVLRAGRWIDMPTAVTGSARKEH